MVATLLFASMRRYPPTEQSTPPSIEAIVGGIRYAVGRRDLLGTYVIDMVAMFMAMPIVLFPAFAEEVLERPGFLGLLYTAESVGTLLATLTSGWTTRFHHHGRAVVVASMCWGASMALVGLAPNVWFALVFLALAGAADMISGIFRATIWNQTIPDHLRGRLAGIEMLSYSLGPMGGSARAGLVADLTSVRASIVSGGVLCVAGVAATAAALRELLALRRAHRRARHPRAGHPGAARRGGRRARVATDLAEPLDTTDAGTSPAEVDAIGQLSLERAQRLMPESTACCSIAASSSSVKSSRSSASRVSSSCATLLAPTSAEVTRGSRSTQAIAIWARDWPRSARDVVERAHVGRGSPR